MNHSRASKLATLALSPGERVSGEGAFISPRRTGEGSLLAALLTRRLGGEKWVPVRPETSDPLSVRRATGDSAVGAKDGQPAAEPRKKPLTRPAPAEDSAGSGHPLPRGEGYLLHHAAFLFVLFLAGTLRAQIAPSPEALVKEAESLQQAGKLDEAIKDYRLFLNQFPDVVPVRSNLGAALAAAGRYEEAIVEYRKALRLQPLPQIRLNLALAYYKAVELNEAVRELLPLHAADQGNLQVALLLGDCYFRLGEFKKAVALLEPLEPANPDNQALTYLLGMSLMSDKQVEKGEVVVNKILRNGDSAAAHLMLGAARLEILDASGAVDELAAAVKLDPKLPMAHYLYGNALLTLGHREDAMENFRQELAIDPNEFGSNLYLGVMLNQGESYKEAVPYLNRALEVRPGDPAVRYQMAIGQIGMGNTQQARKQLEALIKDNPEFLDAHVSLARLYYRLHMKSEGDRERALVAKLTAEVQAQKRAHADEVTKEQPKE